MEACGRMSGLCEDAFLDKGIEKTEIANCLRKLKNNKTGGSDGLVGELLKYGGSGMVCLLEQFHFQLFGRRRLSLSNGERALLLTYLRKEIERIQGTTRGITLLSVVGKVFCKVLNNTVVQRLDKRGVLYESWA